MKEKTSRTPVATRKQTTATAKIRRKKHQGRQQRQGSRQQIGPQHQQYRRTSATAAMPPALEVTVKPTTGTASTRQHGASSVKHIQCKCRGSSSSKEGLQNQRVRKLFILKFSMTEATIDCI